MQLRGEVRHADRHVRRHAGRLPGPRRRGARPVDRDRREHHGDVAAAGPDRHGRDRRGRQRRRAGARRRRPRADARELLLLGDQPRGLRDDPVQGRGRGAAGRRGAADDRARPAAARGHGRGRARAGGRRPHRSGGDRGERQDRDRRDPAASCSARRPDELLERRYDRFRVFGAPGRQPVLPPIEESAT